VRRGGVSAFKLLRHIAFIQLGRSIMALSGGFERTDARGEMSEVNLFLLRTCLLCVPPFAFGIVAGPPAPALATADGRTAAGGAQSHEPGRCFGLSLQFPHVQKLFGGVVAARPGLRPLSRLKLFKVLNGTHEVSTKGDQTVVWAYPDSEFRFMYLWVNTMDERFKTGMQGCCVQKSPN